MQCREALDWLLLPEQGFDATLHRPPGRTFHLPAPAGLAKLDVAHRGILFVRPSVDKHCAVQADFPMTGLQVGDLKAKILQMENVGWTWNSADHGLRRLGNDQLCVRIVGIVTVVLLMKLGGRMRRGREKMNQSSSLSFVVTRYKLIGAFRTGLRHCPFC